MEPDQQELEDKRRELGQSDEPVEEELVEGFETMVEEGAERLTRTWRNLLITGLFGGIDVGIGILLFLAVKQATGSDLLAGAAFGFGLMALSLAHSELFTENFLVPVMAVLTRHSTWLQLLRFWSVTLVTNLAGGWLFTWLVVAAFPDFHDELAATGEKYLSGGLTVETAALALLAGSTITLGTRMSQGSSNEVVHVVIALVDGLLVVGLGMLHGALNSVIVFGAMHAGADISYGEWFLWLLWVIPLNMAGGLVIVTAPRLVRTLELIRKERAQQERRRTEEGRTI